MRYKSDCFEIYLFSPWVKVAAVVDVVTLKSLRKVMSLVNWSDKHVIGICSSFPVLIDNLMEASLLVLAECIYIRPRMEVLTNSNALIL